MGFGYPNLVAGTRGPDSVKVSGANITCSKSVMSDGVVGEFTRFTVTNNYNNGAPAWLYFYESLDISPLLALANGTACTATFLARATKTPGTNSFINVVDANAQNEIFSVVSRSTVPVGGGWSIVTCLLARNSTKESNQVLYMHIGVMPCSVGDTIDITQPMVSLGTTPRAWAPAEGESLAEGGALTSANLWSGATANTTISADGTYLAGRASGELNCNVTGLSSLSGNQTTHMGSSLKNSGVGVLKPFVGYKDAAGNRNWVGFPSWQPSDSWQRFEGSCVVPSGMTISGVGFSNDAATGDIEVANPVFNYGSGPMILASCTHTCKTTEWVPKGEFYVQQPDSYADEIQLTSYDGLYLMGKFKYSEVGTAYPATLQKIVTDICTRAGLTFDGSAVSSLSYQVPSRNPDMESMTGLQVASYAAQAAGCYLRRSNTTGGVVAGWYDLKAFEGESWADGGTYEVTSGSTYGDGDAYDGGTFDTTTTPYSDGAVLEGGTFDADKSVYVLGMFSSLTTSTDDVVITGVKVTAKNEVVIGSDGKQTNGRDGETSLAGNDGYVLSLSDNPLVAYGQASAVANQVYARVGGMRFRAFNATCRPDPSVEPGDPIVIEDRLGRVYRSYVTRVNLTLNGSMTLVCGAKTPARNSAESASAATQAIVQARNEVKREKTERELAQEQLQKELSAELDGKLGNLSGLYSTIDTLSDGSHVYYLSDKPTLAASKIVWKMAAGAVGVSTDGGKTYATGLTAEGDALMNRIYAHGINADYINAGTYTVTDSSGKTVVIIGNKAINGIEVLKKDALGNEKLIPLSSAAFCENVSVPGPTDSTEIKFGFDFSNWKDGTEKSAYFFLSDVYEFTFGAQGGIRTDGELGNLPCEPHRIPDNGKLNSANATPGRNSVASATYNLWLAFYGDGDNTDVIPWDKNAGKAVPPEHGLLLSTGYIFSSFLIQGEYSGGKNADGTKETRVYENSYMRGGFKEIYDAKPNLAYKTYKVRAFASCHLSVRGTKPELSDASTDFNDEYVTNYITNRTSYATDFKTFLMAY